MSEQAQGAGARVNTGGPAHPFLTWQNPQGFCIGSLHEGLTIRDHFAGQALQGFAQVSMSSDWPYSPDAMAKEAYSWADSMIAARGEA